MDLRFKKKDNSAYLLVEVLVTVVVLGVAIVFIVRALSASLLASRRAGSYTQALLLMEQLANQANLEVISGQSSSGVFPRSAEVSSPGINFQLKEELEPTDIPPLAEVIFTISWRDAKIGGEFSASTLLPIPTSE